MKMKLLFLIPFCTIVHVSVMVSQLSDVPGHRKLLKNGDDSELPLDPNTLLFLGEGQYVGSSVLRQYGVGGGSSWQKRNIFWVRSSNHIMVVSVPKLTHFSDSEPLPPIRTWLLDTSSDTYKPELVSSDRLYSTLWGERSSREQLG